MNVGVVGYSGQKFDEEKAKGLISTNFDLLETITNEDIVIISGLTNLGIPKLAYEEAVKRGWKTVGIACKKAKDYECFDVDETTIVGDNWGDESETFLNSLDVICRFGGGKQSLAEVDEAKEAGLKVFEYELKAEG
jgi:hypothetical protein